MQLGELIGLRPVPCAGLLLTVTQRCPLSCAHCSSGSTMAGTQPDAEALVRFVGSFRDPERPDVVLLTGGEPLLRPGLVADLVSAARRAGTRSALLTGAFFARGGRYPAEISRAVRLLDHLSVSLDVFHEQQISRHDVYRLLRRVLDAGVPVSLHTVSSGPHDPYVDGLVAQTRRVFGDEVPMLVNTLRAVGRAAGWAAPAAVLPEPSGVLPCAMAAWPVVTQDGTVVGCCNQDTVDGRPVPEHLRLGHVAVDDWPDVRARALSSPVLRLIRATGPAYLRARYAVADRSAPGYCAGCRGLGADPAALAAIRSAGTGPVGELLDRHAAQVQYRAGPVALVRRHGCAGYADLVAPPRPLEGV